MSRFEDRSRVAYPVWGLNVDIPLVRVWTTGGPELQEFRYGEYQG